jgi:hypothetical protein
MLTPDAKVYAIEDVVRNFNFESLFSLITEGAVVEKRRKDKFRMPFEDSPKVVITTNYAIPGTGDSFRRRMEEFDLSNYYNAKKRPVDDFGHYFYDEWDEYQYNLFDNLMILACRYYLKSGFMQAPSEYIFEKKLKSVVQPDELADFIMTEVKLDSEYNNNDLFSQYLKQAGSETQMTQRQFSNAIKAFADLSGFRYQGGHSGERRYFSLVE